MYDIVALGEALIDFTRHGQSENGNALYEQNPGGAPANVLTMCAGLGLSTAFIGKVGADLNGDFIRKFMRQKGIEVKGLVSSDEAFTTLAFVDVNEGERHFTFARKPGADALLTEAEVDFEIVRATKIFHFGSLSLTQEPVRTATVKAIRAAKAAGATISYDPNYRPDLWKRADEAAKRLRGAVHLADIVVVSKKEAQLMTDKAEPEEAAVALLEMGVTCAIVTLGADGALAATKEGIARKMPPEVVPIDTMGAGGIFMGGFLYRLAKSGKAIAEHSLKEIEGYVAFANAAAAISVEKRGGIPSMPDISAIYERLS